MKSLEQKLSRIDLNLLVSFSMLLQEKNVSRAAEKLYVSQPAMSRTLQKLRELFDDPLFLRESAGLKPTVKALQLAKQLTPLLSSINQYIEKEEFNPATCDKSFSISLPSLMTHSLMLPFIFELNKIAPNITISLHPATTEPEKHLENGMFDFSINVAEIHLKNFTCTQFTKIHPAIFARKGHPLSRLKNVAIKDCLKYKFLDLVVDNHAKLEVVNPAFKYFLENKIELDIAMKCGQLAILTEVMKQTDHLFIGSQFLMESQTLKQDFKLLYEFTAPVYQTGMFLCDHQRTHNSEAHQWLKDTLLRSLTKTLK